MIVDAPTHYAEIRDLERGANYKVSVTAINENEDESVASNTVNTRTDITVGGTVPPAPVDLDDDHILRTENSLILTWNQVANGGSPILKYYINVAPTGGDAFEVETEDASQMSQLIDNLNIGTKYSFTVCAENEVGKGPESDALTGVFANLPDAPAAPSTVNNGQMITFTWSESANDNGAEITGYEVYINHHFDHEWTQSSECDITSAGGDYMCEVSIETLMKAPFSLEVGQTVLAKVVAINDIGMSEESEEGGEALIITVPDAPTAVATSMVENDDGDFLHISFVPPRFNGGSSITGYRYFVKPELSDVYQEVEFIQVTDHSADVSAIQLKGDPWVIRDHSDVFAKVAAVNEVGETRSEAGHGAVFIIPCE